MQLICSSWSAASDDKDAAGGGGSGGGSGGGHDPSSLDASDGVPSVGRPDGGVVVADASHDLPRRKKKQKKKKNSKTRYKPAKIILQTVNYCKNR